MLCRQGRMNVEVARFPNHAFYGGLLEPVGLQHQQGELTLAPGLEMMNLQIYWCVVWFSCLSAGGRFAICKD